MRPVNQNASFNYSHPHYSHPPPSPIRGHHVLDHMPGAGGGVMEVCFDGPYTIILLYYYIAILLYYMSDFFLNVQRYSIINAK